jgi:type IV pilus assembly protein PilV
VDNKQRLKLRPLLERNQQGFSLIEVLVAIFIMAVGLFGLASLQMVSLQNINSTQSRTLATDYAYDMAERMRSNRTAMTAGNYDAIVLDGNETDPGCTSCTPDKAAEYDVYQWGQQIAGLPNGSGSITKNGNEHEITVSWDEQESSSLSGVVTASFKLTIQL